MSDEGALAGTGIVESVASAVGHLDDPGLLAMDAAIVGLDALGFIANPLAGLLSAGLGFIIENVPFLHEPLDALAGDPGAIAAVAAVWGETVKSELAASGADLDAAVASLTPSWTFPAVDAYLATASQVREFIDGLQTSCDGVVSAVQVSGILVATVRSLIRDLITDFVGEVVAAWLVAAASSWFTLGGSVAGFIGWSVFRGTVVAGRITSKIADLVDKLADVLSRFSQLAEAVRRLRVAAVHLNSMATTLGHSATAAGASATAGARTIAAYARAADTALGTANANYIKAGAGVPAAGESQDEKYDEAAGR